MTVKWLGFPMKKDWTFEPYENFSTEARTKLYQFHINNPAAPRDHRVTSDLKRSISLISFPINLSSKVLLLDSTIAPLTNRVIDRALGAEVSPCSLR